MTTSKPNPYVGPRAFMTGEKLYGRDRELRELMDLLIAERIVLLYSPSGAGKSSLIHAGLLPGLEQENFNILPVMRVSQDLNGNASQGNRYINSVLFSLDSSLPPEQRTPPEKLFGLSFETYLAGRPRPEGASTSDVIVFDQFEEILTVQPADREAKMAFFTQIGTALRDRKRWALFAMREDYLAPLDPYLRPMPTRLSNRYRLDFLGPQAAMEAVQNPARSVGVDFTDNAALKLVDDLRCIQVQQADGTVEKQLGLYVEPVQLQVACYRLWENLSADDPEITPEDIASIGNVDQSLADYYSQSVRQTAEELKLAERSIREWFEEKLITENGLRSQVQRGSSQGLPDAVIRKLENTHLVRAEKRAGSTWYELAHDRLIGPVRADNEAWLHANLTPLQRQTKLWEKQERLASLLLRGEELARAVAWRKENPAGISPLEAVYLEVSLDAARREDEARQLSEQKLKLEAAEKLAESERRRAEEQERAAKKLRRRAMILTIALVALVSAAAIAVFFAFQAQIKTTLASTNAQMAEEARQTSVANAGLATTQQFVAQTQQANAETASTQSAANAFAAQTQQALAEAASTEAISKQQTAVAANLNLANISGLAVQGGGSSEAMEQASNALSRSLAAIVFETAASNQELGLLLAVEAYNAAPSQEATDALNYALGLVHYAYLSPPTVLGRNTSQFAVTAISQDGRYAAFGLPSGRVSVWSVLDGSEILSEVANAGARITALAFSSDGQLLASGDQLGEINLWDMNSGRFLYFLEAEAQVTCLAFSPDNSILASGGFSSSIYFWRVDRSHRPVSMNTLTDDVMTELAFSPNGLLLASGDATGKIWLWDTTGLHTIQDFISLHTRPVTALAWMPDGSHFASGSDDEEQGLNLAMWQVGRSDGVGLYSHVGGVTGVVFTPDGQIFISSGKDGSLAAWEFNNLALLTDPVVDPEGSLAGLAINPNGNWIVTVAENGALEQRTLREGGSTVEQACQMAGRNLTQEEWATYFQYQDYRETCPN